MIYSGVWLKTILIEMRKHLFCYKYVGISFFDSSGRWLSGLILLDGGSLQLLIFFYFFCEL